MKPSPIAKKLNRAGRKNPSRREITLRTMAERKQNVETMRSCRSTEGYCRTDSLDGKIGRPAAKASDARLEPSLAHRAMATQKILFLRGSSGGRFLGHLPFKLAPSDDEIIVLAVCAPWTRRDIGRIHKSPISHVSWLKAEVIAHRG